MIDAFVFFGLLLGLGVGGGICLAGILTREKCFNIFGIILLIIGILAMIVGVAYPTPAPESIVTEIDVWYTDAPFGTYWVEFEGGGNFIGFRIGSELRESYTIKYLVGDRLESMLFETDEIEVYLTEDLQKMTLKHTCKYRWWYDDRHMYDESWKLYIPNPDLFGG